MRRWFWRRRIWGRGSGGAGLGEGSVVVFGGREGGGLAGVGVVDNIEEMNEFLGVELSGGEVEMS